MILYIGITCFTILAGFFINTTYRQVKGSRQRMVNAVSLFAVFLVLFAVSALRVGIGNDYWVYRYQFQTIWVGDTPVSFEAGFNAVVILMQKLFGYDNYIPIFALFSFATVAFFLKGIYELSDWFMYSAVIFMANGFYFMSFDNIRYYLVLAMSLCAMSMFLKKKYGWALLWIIVGAFFHKTILLCIPLFILAKVLKWSKMTVWIIPAVSVLLIFGKRIVRFLLFKIYPYYEGDAILDNTSLSYGNIAKCLAVLVFCLIEIGFEAKKISEKKLKSFLGAYFKTFSKKAGEGNYNFFFNLNLCALILYSFASYVPELSRICFYMVVGQMFLIPMVLKDIEDKKRKRFWLVVITLAFIGYYAIFMVKGAKDDVMILPYLTWIFG